MPISVLLIALLLSSLLFTMLGIVIGRVITMHYMGEKLIGTLHLETSDPDGPYLFLELDHNGMERIEKNKHALVHVDTKSYISRK